MKNTKESGEDIKRIGNKPNAMEYYAWKCRDIQYYGKGHKGEVTPFMKRDIYKRQQEVRFVVGNTVN